MHNPEHNSPLYPDEEEYLLSEEAAEQALHEFGEQCKGGPIIGYLTIEKVPEGEAPVEIRQQWVGAHLPIRERTVFGEPWLGTSIDSETAFIIERAALIDFGDCTDALEEAGRKEVADWWRRHNFEEVMKGRFGHSILIFDMNDGVFNGPPS